MDNLILGLLMFKGRSIYEIKSRIEQGLSMMYSASIGSIQAAINKLLKAGFIEFIETVENGKYKKIYTITDAGRQKFSQWANSTINISSEKHPELLKIYFMGLSDKQGRRTRISQHIDELQKSHAQLKMIISESESIKVPDEMRDVFYYQLMSAKFGVDFMEFQINWYTKMLEQIERENY